MTELADWTQADIARCVNDDADALMQRHGHWIERIELDREEFVELLTELAKRGPDYYRKQLGSLRDLLHGAETRYLGRSVH